MSARPSEAQSPPARRFEQVEPENIPATLKAHARWAPWRGEWNAKRGKWDKVPCSPSGYRLSTKRPAAWVAFETALQAHQRGGFDGVGYLMTGEHGLVGVDLDRCVDGDGKLTPWARELIESAGSYAELSPSGTGARLFLAGAAPHDGCNHAQGLEVYAGHAPRFLTVTGRRLPMAPAGVNAAPPGFLDALAKRYGLEPKTRAEIGGQPDLVDELALPDLAALELPYEVRDFLGEGTAGADRSRMLFRTAVALYRAGLDDAQVLSVLAANPHAMAVALDHRRQDPDRAIAYLWAEHGPKARARAEGAGVATADDFDDVRQQDPASCPPAASSDATPAGTAPRSRFAPVSAGEMKRRPLPRWLIKHVLPESGVCMVYGPSTSGKSFLALDLCMAIARGVDWFGHKTQRPGAVAYVVAEGAGGFGKRLHAYDEHHGSDSSALPLSFIPAAPNLLEVRDVRELVAELKALPDLRVVTVDTLAQTTPGADENSSADMGRALAHCRSIGEATGALVLLVGHTGKDATKGPRGHSSQFAAFDAVIEVERSGELRQATVRKAKDGEEGQEFPFHLVSVTLGQDEDGEDVTSCVVAPGHPNGAARKLPKVKGPKQAILLRVLEDLTHLTGPPTTAELLDAARDLLPKAPDGKDRRRADAARALEGLIANSAVRVTEGRVGLC